MAHIKGDVTPERRRLPQRRSAETFTLDSCGHTFTCTVGRFPDGSIGELFLSNKKSNQIGSMAADAAILASILIQMGVDLTTIRKSLMRDPVGQAMTPIGVALDAIAEDEERK